MLRKKIIALICIVGLSFSLTACGASEKTATSDQSAVSEARGNSSNKGSFLQNLTGGSKTDSAPAEVDGGSYYMEAETNGTGNYYVTESAEAMADMAVGAPIDPGFTYEGEYYEPDFNTEEYNFIKENSFLNYCVSIFVNCYF